jgi:ribose transport system ATP-binding protein
METRFGAPNGTHDGRAPQPPQAVGAGNTSETPPGHVVLVAEHVSKSFAGVTALKDVDFELRYGEVHALMGENGAGKSTLMKILAGVQTQYQGAIQVEGRALSFGAVRNAEEAGVAMIHQELNLVPDLSVADNIFLGREPLIAGVLIDRRRIVRGAQRLLRHLGVDIDPERRVAELRIGEQQSVEIAKALSLDARILIMDEPHRRCRHRNARRFSRSHGSSPATESRSSTPRTASKRFSISPIG